jgi:hypothetical protein
MSFSPAGTLRSSSRLTEPATNPPTPYPQATGRMIEA